MTSPREDAALDAGADGDHLVGVDPLVGSLAEDVLDLFLHGRHAGHAADQDDLVDLAGGESGILEGGAAGAFQFAQQVGADRLQLGAGELQGQVLRPGGVGGDEGQVDVGLHGGRQLALGLFGRLLQALQGHLVAAQVDALVLFEFVGDPVDDQLVEILAAQEGVAVGGLDLEDAVAQFQDGDVEGAAAQVEDGDLLVLLLVEAVGQGGRGRLVDDAQDVQSGDLAGILGCLALGIVEIGRNGDDRIGNRLPR